MGGNPSTSGVHFSVRRCSLVNEALPEPKTDLASSASGALVETAPEPTPTPQVPSPDNQPISVPVRDASAPNGLRYRPMKPWERMEGDRLVQFRPMTRREREAEQDAAFFAAVRKDDEAHKEKQRKADEECKRWAKEDRQRREHEERTGTRPYEPGRYLDIEDAEKRGYLSGNS